MNNSDHGLGQTDLFEGGDLDITKEMSRDSGWPDPSRFPFSGRDQSIQSIVFDDLLSSTDALIITGYASLEKIIDYCTRPKNSNESIRLLFGNEPTESGQRSLSLTQSNFPEEVRRYWMSRGISVLLSAKLISSIEKIKSGRIQARFIKHDRRKLHAKIYASDSGVILGSSNFSHNGLINQLEANVRFSSAEKARYREAKQFAEQFWEMGSDYNQDLIALLERLLQIVSWREALARACAEVLEGDWAERYMEFQMLPGQIPLWPSQKQGIAQALWLLETVGSVLIADATGSGKTRMGAYLIRGAIDRIWSIGRTWKGKALLLCPPTVQNNWESETRSCQTPIDIHSQGMLSQSNSESGQAVVDSLKSAQVLNIDEAHNFLNINSKRTRMLLGNMADHVILFTATPINKGSHDLLHLVDLLGADNLDDATLDMFSSLLVRRRNINRSLTDKEVQQLRKQIQQFTVRRTKKMFNELIDDEPDEYRSKSGDLCRYPRHDSKCYPLNESKQDRNVAETIRELADSLDGVALIQKPIYLPDVLQREGWDEQKYLDSRLLSAKRLAAYQIMKCLRSSRAALIEHLAGTHAALAFEHLDPSRKKNHSGDMLGNLRKRSGNPPGSELSIPVPDWIKDSKSHREISESEIRKYEKILLCAKELSDGRETSKVKHLLKQSIKHRLSIAFDSKPITLQVLKQRIKMQHPSLPVAVATGENRTEKDKVQRMFAHGSSDQGIALCSDAMSEGVNLQQASAVSLLDMPSVVRIAEQRVGRVDRMDSPHESIDAWWPDDAPEFQLTTDDRLVERLETVETLIGSNMPIPIEKQTSNRVSAKSIIAEYEQNMDKGLVWDNIHDAFQPVRDLVDGDASLIPQVIYQHYQHETLNVLSRVSPVQSDRPWAFFCIAGTKFGAPRWVYLDNTHDKPKVSITEITSLIRERLGPDTQDLEMDKNAQHQLQHYTERLNKCERDLLPKRKQRALYEMELIITSYREKAGQEQNHQAFEFYNRLINVLSQSDPDYVCDLDDVADRWLGVIRPVWYEKLVEPKRTRPLVLKDIRQDLLAKQLPFEKIQALFQSIPTIKPIGQRVVAVILGCHQRIKPKEIK